MSFALGGVFASLVMSMLLAAVSPASAQTCTKRDISSVVDTTASKLRRLNAGHQPELQAKLRQLGEQRGWSDEERERNSAEFFQDEEARSLDEQASRLLIEFDALGDDTSFDQSSCQSRLERLNTVSAQLIEITTAKAAHITARVETALATQASPPRTAARPPPVKAEPKPKVADIEPLPVPPAPAVRAPAPLPPTARTPAPPPAYPPYRGEDRTMPAPDRPEVRSWETDTRHAPPGDLSARPPPFASLPPRLQEAEDMEFSADEISAAGRGFFGSLSAGLASVIEYAFRNYGRPNGYILGSEGGAALLAGLRYGDGHLVTKAAGERKVYWQGPSVGTDIGLAGSRVMFLVYNLREQNDLFTRFAGVDGSAYLVGGVGITFLKKGRLVLAPIRTGLGLRVGANVGYLKFTPEVSFNPF